MNKMKEIILLATLILLVVITSVDAYIFTYPTPYYYDGRENVEIDMSYIEKFENAVPEYLRYNLEVEFTTRNSANKAWIHCTDNRIVITMYRDSWIDYDYGITGIWIWHEITHLHQCRILNELPNHEDSFYEIELE